MRKLLLVLFALSLTAFVAAQSNKILLTMVFQKQGWLQGSVSAAGVSKAVLLLSVVETKPGSSGSSGAVSISRKAAPGSKAESQFQQAFQNRENIERMTIYMIGKKKGKEVVLSHTDYNNASISSIKATANKEVLKIEFMSEVRAR